MEQVFSKILNEKKITTSDEIYFEKIADVIARLFTDYNGISQLQKGYNLNEVEQIWCLNVDEEYDLDQKLSEGYYNWVSNDGLYIYNFNAQKDLQKRLKDIDKLIATKTQFIVFKQTFKGTKKSQYQFYGVFMYDKTLDDGQTIAYKKISDEFKFNFKDL
ncbi:hypothetical protein [Spiroplasma culicicola]|uniref:PvuRts1 I-like SET and RING associated domain-containing protein n=1 Tax=Spiroplasma culicicola AES-1 TaxID=1276246 RepID=W6AI26_9MOLU|nr:hypothetical protein [Spiroplasma culicicola]AHI53354.1 hypothetical protein SCULI_v1c10140 [Spiroplasma culicicola AES-1]